MERSAAPSGITELLADARALFTDSFGSAPAVASAAPGRVNLIGDHVDYVGGTVLPMAVDRFTVAVAAFNALGRDRLVSRAESGAYDLALDAAPGLIRPRWLRYPAGVLAALRAQALLDPRAGVDIAIASDVPIGSGLSSSAALEAAACLVAEAIASRGLDPLSRARLCQSAEHRFAGVPCGIMDQYTVCLARTGCAMLLDCRDLTHEDVSLPENLAFIVVDSGIRHALADDAYARRRAECEHALEAISAVCGVPRGSLDLAPAVLDAAIRAGANLGPIEARRARHVVTEIARTRAAAAALRRGDGVTLGALMAASHQSLRDDYEVSVPQVDALVAAVQSVPGVFGARMTGGGFGGCIVAAVEGDAAATVVRRLAELLPPGRLCIPVRPAERARVLHQR